MKKRFHAILLQKIKEKAKKSNMNLTKYLTVCGLNKDIVVIQNLKEFQIELSVIVACHLLFYIIF